MRKRSALTAGAAALLLAVVVVAGCASTEVTERQRYEGAKLARPDRIIVHDFTAQPRRGAARIARLPPKWPAPPADPGAARGRPQAGRSGRQASWWRICGAWGCRPCGPRANRAPRADDIVLRGYFVSVDEGRVGRRVLVGFGSGAAELRTAVEGYQMTAQGLRPLGRGEVRSEGGKLPGMVVASGRGRRHRQPDRAGRRRHREGDRRGDRVGDDRRRRRAYRG